MIYLLQFDASLGFPGSVSGKKKKKEKKMPAKAGDMRDVGSIPGFGRFPWRRAWQPTPVFLLGESHGQRSLTGYSLRVTRSQA